MLPLVLPQIMASGSGIQLDLEKVDLARALCELVRKY